MGPHCVRQPAFVKQRHDSTCLEHGDLDRRGHITHPREGDAQGREVCHNSPHMVLLDKLGENPRRRTNEKMEWNHQTCQLLLNQLQALLLTPTVVMNHL
jgi:hypothetical protein